MAHLKDKQSGYSTGAMEYAVRLISSLCLWFPFEANEGQRVGQDVAPALLQNVPWMQSPSPDKDLLQ